MWFRGRVSVNWLKTGPIRIDDLDQSHDGLSYMAYVEQITFLLFLKMADE